jgi:TonB family protein
MRAGLVGLRGRGKCIWRIVVLSGALCCFAGVPVFLRAQTRPEVEKIAAQTAKEVAKLRIHNVMTAPLLGCLGAPELCAEVDAAVHAELQKAISDVQFIDRDEGVKHLADYGFLSVDAYLGALDVVASDAGVEVVIGEDFVRQRGDCKLATTVSDAKHVYSLEGHSVGISCTAVTTKTTVAPITDAATGASLLAPMPWSPGLLTGASPVRGPSCEVCPEPHYSGLAREKGIQGTVRVLITVNKQGRVENPRLVSAVEDGLARASLEAVRGWLLKPAIGLDGKPATVRVPVEVTFRLLPG